MRYYTVILMRELILVGKTQESIKRYWQQLVNIFNVAKK